MPKMLHNNLLSKTPTILNSPLTIAIIVALLGALGYLIIYSGILTTIFKTHNPPPIIADTFDTGSAYGPSGDFHLFTEINSPMAVGEVQLSANGIKQEVESRFFISFSLGEIPEDVQISKAQLEIPCKLQGDLASLTELRLKALEFGQYDLRYFDSYTSDYWPNLYFDVGWPAGQETQYMAKSLCGDGGKIVISSQNNLINAVSASLPFSFMQFMIWFENQPALLDNKTNAILITGLPILRLTSITK